MSTTNRLPRILLADDDLDLCRMMQLNLAGLPYRLSIAHTGTAALFEYEAARTVDDPFDLLILDVRMTQQSGLSVAEAIREQGDNETPIIFFTADSSPMTVARERTVHPVQVWQKPLGVDGIAGKIEAALHTKEQVHE